jgi:cell division protein FtsI/penicillin-binding protein 2
MRIWRNIVVVACLAAAGIAQQQSASLTAFTRQQLKDANAPGFIHVRDVKSGRVLAHAASGDDLAVDSPVAPLSVIKVFVAAMWLEHGFGDTVVDCDASARYPVRHMKVEDVIASSCDTAGKRMAVLLRQKLGAKRVLADLRRYGIEGITLKSDAGDEDWGSVLSLGERDVPVTPLQVSRFFAAIGNGGGKLMSARTAQTIQAALGAVVQRGTADSIKDALAGTGWRIGGKTGTGPGLCGDHCDGWFAGFVSDPRGGRYVVLAFIRGRGLGGGVAAHVVAAVAEYLASKAADKH